MRLNNEWPVHGWCPVVGEDANTSRGVLGGHRGGGGGKDGAFLGHVLSSLQTVMCPLQFSSTKWNELSDSLNQIPDLHIFNRRTEMKGVGVWRVQGQKSCIHAAFVQNFLIEYKNRWWIVWSSFCREFIGQDWLRSCGDKKMFLWNTRTLLRPAFVGF